MNETKDIIVVADYHAENIEFRCLNRATGQMGTGRYPTGQAGILSQLEQAQRDVMAGGRLVWIMESTTGWARVKDLIAERFGQGVHFLLCNVLQMPLPPKARRRKSDTIDTHRILREYLNGQMPTSFQPPRWWREVRRVVDYRQDLVERRMAIKNWIGSLLHHETWEDRTNLWSERGLARLKAMTSLSPSDRTLVEMKLTELARLNEAIVQVEGRMKEISDGWPDAQRVDQLRGIGLVTAVSLLAHIGPIERFASAEELIAYAGLAPGYRESDQSRRDGHIGGGGTDSHLRYLVIEASSWLCQIPRYQLTYERTMARRGIKIARIVVARLALRSIFKLLKDKVAFNPANPAPRTPPRQRVGPGRDAFIALGPAGKKPGMKPGMKRAKDKGPDGPRSSRASRPSCRIGTGPALGSLASVALSSEPAKPL